jgi:hypothetical protein
MTTATTILRLVPAFLLAAAGLGAGCDGSGKATTDAGTPATPSGVVVGPLDSHCSNHDGGQRMQALGVCEVVDKSEIPSTTSGCGISFTADAGASHDDGAADDVDAGAATSEYGETMYGSAGNDDDCKYYISWVATPIHEDADTYFTVTAIRLADGKPASCAGIRPDISLSLTHGVPAPKDPAPEIAPGVYKVGPIRFDAAGNSPGHYWTVRFHLYEECSDTPEDSPHGHAAFYVSVP